MMTKREAEMVQEIVWSMTERDYQCFLAWFSNGAQGDLWDYVRPRRRGSAVVFTADVAAASVGELVPHLGPSS
jgi:hypothetical protein